MPLRPTKGTQEMMMSRFSTAAVAAGMTLTLATATTAQEPGEFRRSTYHDYRMVTVVEDRKSVV